MFFLSQQMKLDLTKNTLILNSPQRHLFNTVQTSGLCDAYQMTRYARAASLCPDWFTGKRKRQ